MSLTPLASNFTKGRKRGAEESAGARQPSRRRSHSYSSLPPPSFFDNLSKLPLCLRVLREFDRRTQPYAHASQPQTRQLSASDHTNLKRFARLGGPGLDDVRSYPEPGTDMPPQRRRRVQFSDSTFTREAASSKSKTCTRTRTRKTNAYDPVFKQHLEDYGIFPQSYQHPVYPGNLAAIRKALGRRRASLSPSYFTTDAFLQFAQDSEKAESEIGLMSTAFRTIIGNNDIPNQQNVLFGNLAPLTDGSLSMPKPDFFDGSRPRDLEVSIRANLSDQIAPSAKSSIPVIPNFFVEGKGPEGKGTVSKLQACYDAAFGARGIHSLRMYIDPGTALDGDAYTISATFIGGSDDEVTLALYATHLVASENANRPLEYHMTKVGSFSMTHDPKVFREGAAAIRNAREWAQEQRASLIAAANAKASS